MNIPGKQARAARGYGAVLFALALLLAACNQAASANETAADTDEVPVSLQSLRYGVTLYYFYQQDYFDALTELMAGQQLRDLATHHQHGELLQAGMSLSYGMDQLAESMFRELLLQPEAKLDRDRVWFYLAKMAWQRGEPTRARAALGRMSPLYDGPLAVEANYLRASIDLRSGDTAGAAALAQRLPEDSPWRYYYDYNLGAALASAGDWSAAVTSFQRLGPQPLDTEEGLALQDKAFTAAGFAALAADEPEQAKVNFTRVRLASPLADRALLGFGWAHAELEDYQAALSPWLALAEQDPVSASVRQSMLAVPYAYEQLGRPGVALQRYRQAAEVYTAELAALQAAIDVFVKGDLPDLLQPGEAAAQDWLSGQAILPEGDHLPYIRHLVTRHGFQRALRELRDLRGIEAHLAAARQRLQVLQEADVEQQQSWATVTEGDRDEQLRQRQALLQQQVEVLRRRVEAASASGDGRSLAGAGQSARWQRLESAAAAAAGLPLSAEQARQLALYRGLMIWDDNERFPARAWELRRELQSAEALVRQTGEAAGRLDAAMAQRGQAGFAPRIAALETRVGAGLGRVQLAIGTAQAQLRQVAVVELERQVAQLSRALGQSRLAIARLYDKGSTEVPR